MNRIYRIRRVYPVHPVNPVKIKEIKLPILFSKCVYNFLYVKKKPAGNVINNELKTKS